MADSNVPITAGSGTTVHTYQLANATHEQYIRPATGTAKTNNSWTVNQTGQASQIAADASRVGLMANNGSSGRVYINFSSTIPTTTVYDTFVEAGERFECPDFAKQFALSMLGQFAGGTFYSTLFTAA